MMDSSPPPTVSISADKFASLFASGSSNVRAERALEALTAEDAVRVPEGYPHSVAAIAAHMQFWQSWLLARLLGNDVPFPEHAEAGWPPGNADDWEALRVAFFESLAALQAWASKGDEMNEPAFAGQRTAEALLDGAS